MASDQTTVIATITAKPGMEAQVKAELQKLLAPTRSEKGCINYDMHEAKDNPGRFVFYENWVCEEDLSRHLESPHIKNWFALCEDLLAEPVKISLWKKTD